MPALFQKLFPSLIWRMPVDEKIIYLTFDDGPIPEVTPWVLEKLKAYDARATFFCVGDNVRKNPELMKQILDDGHTVGNHTMRHLKGWQTSNKNYFADIEECGRYVQSSLFRPPYGKIKISQMLALRKKYRIIMWDVLSKDYDVTLKGNQCFENVKSSARNGSIVVFHDSLKAEERLRVALPSTLEYFSNQGYSFHSIQL